LENRYRGGQLSTKRNLCATHGALALIKVSVYYTLHGVGVSWVLSPTQRKDGGERDHKPAVLSSTPHHTAVTQTETDPMLTPRKKLHLHDKPVQLDDETQELGRGSDVDSHEIFKTCDEYDLYMRLVIASNPEEGKILVALNGGEKMDTLHITMALMMMDEAMAVLMAKLPENLRDQVRKRYDKKAQH
jgi:hypothetical protein